MMYCELVAFEAFDRSAGGFDVLYSRRHTMLLRVCCYEIKASIDHAELKKRIFTSGAFSKMRDAFQE